MESPSMLLPTTSVVDSPASDKPVSIFHRYFLLLKGHYFLFFSAFGVLYPILNITLRSRGLSNTEISYINLIIPFLVFFMNPLCGYLADHTRRYLLVFNLTLALVTIFYSTLFFLPSIKTYAIEGKIVPQANQYLLDFCASEEVGSKCSSRSECGCFYQALCRDDQRTFNFNFTMNKTNFYDKSDCGTEYKVPLNDLSLSPSMTCQITCSTPHFCQGKRHPKQLWIVFLYSILFIIGTNCLYNAITLGASIGFAFLPQPELFGQQRVWGTVGFGLSAFLASLIFKIFRTEYVYILMFGVTTALCILVTSFISIHPEKQKQIHEQELKDLAGKQHSKEKKGLSQLRVAQLAPLLKKLDVIVFLSLTFVWGMSYASLDPYVYLYVDEIAPCQSHSVVGLMTLIASISEILAFYLAARIIKHLGTNFSSLAIFLAFAVRFAGYYFIHRPYFLLFNETMHFFNFGILYVLVAQKADSIAPPGLSGTLQGVVYGLCFGLGRGVGLIAASFIYTRLQSRMLFLIFSVFNLSAAVVYGIYFLLHRKPVDKSTRPTGNSNIPKIVIDSVEPSVPEDPLLNSSATA